MRRLLMILAAWTLTACQPEPQLATLTDDTPETMAALSAVLATATGRATVRLGPADVTRSPEVTVLPALATRLEGNSPAMPTVFEIVLVDGDCYVRDRESGEIFLLTHLSCTPV